MSRRPPASDDTDSGFLSRWSRRKAGRDGSEAAGPANDAEAANDGSGLQAPAPDAAASPEPGEAEQVKTDADMPDLDVIDETTDMSDFFSPGVSEELRNRALRRLFRMSKFNVTDGLDDYNDDFRDFALLGDIVTSDMRHRMETERRQAEESDEPAADEQAVADAGGETATSPERDDSAPAVDREPAAGREETGTDSDSDDTDDLRPDSSAKT